ncbi:BQ5605_C010g06163 [Microbotryum silenes-dioicae]|uniref:BQ5605_C010g06163 protein n=1 Tax=Microbotryum silenes-dioicae TaxID=796604 RepID=A0A2X0LQS6_9BASI|nr:BQ5605_C010g06163 [Microbotryum silenes-dioicae]
MSFTPEGLHTTYSWVAHLDDETPDALHPSLRMRVARELGILRGSWTFDPSLRWMRREKREPVWRYISPEERSGLGIRVELEVVGGGADDRLVAEVRGFEEGMDGNLPVEFDLDFAGDSDALDVMKSLRGKVTVTVTFGNLPSRQMETMMVSEQGSGKDVWDEDICRRLLERERLWRGHQSTPHPFDVRFTFEDDPRPLFENADFLVANSPYWQSMLQGEFLESAKTTDPSSTERTCDYPMHIVRVGEARREDYRDVLVWLRTGHLVNYETEEQEQVEHMGTSSSTLEKLVFDVELGTLVKVSGMYRLALALELESLRGEMLQLLKSQIEAGFELEVLWEELPLEHDDVMEMLVEQLVQRGDWIEGTDGFKILQEWVERGEMGEAGKRALELLGKRFEKEREKVERERELREMRLIR